MAAAADNTSERFEVETLWVDSILTDSVPIDWSDSYGEDGDGWVSYEAPECPEHYSYGIWDADRGAWLCPDCGEEIAETGEGPMMSYHYPLRDLDRIGSPQDAASAIRDLPLCVVEFADGSASLALTGGGMDLSWEICAAFTRLGYLPPFRFAQDPPRLAGHAVDPYVLAACRRTADVLKSWTEQAAERLASFRLEELRQVLRSESISYGELAELQELAGYIQTGDVELLEAAGVPEHDDEDGEESAS